MSKQLVPATNAFVEAMAPLIPSALHSMSPPLQILCVGCGMCIHFPPLRYLTLSPAAVMIAAKAFWAHPGDTQAPQITASSKHYIQSSTAGHVGEAILEAFQGIPGLYDTPESIAALQQVLLSNYKSYMSKPMPDSVL
ncbi:hypothetical protein BOTBODRAFT_564596 [Botryobasidium botryosum FD-172 SS1]|uniref:Uncharacterized protein n=1 Tax=Botryobasidium botryosum (strain FD-172 SS1) TaxID=930990 RepID=A0A067M9L7_BOTB1|nr:hypothetical protein BOTBODRAFT_564596 [Botryobasidium botryosum FD-172 SS1]